MRGSREIWRSGLEKFLENIIGKHATPGGEPRCFAIECEQAAFGKRFDDLERTGNHLVAELLPEGRNRNSAVETKAEEPCLLVLALR